MEWNENIFYLILSRYNEITFQRGQLVVKVKHCLIILSPYIYFDK